MHLSELLLGVLHTQACCAILYLCVFICADIYALSLYVKTLNTVTSLFRWICYTAYMYIKAQIYIIHRFPGLVQWGLHVTFYQHVTQTDEYNNKLIKYSCYPWV